MSLRVDLQRALVRRVPAALTLLLGAFLQGAPAAAQVPRPLSLEDIPAAWIEARDDLGVVDSQEAERMGILAAGAGRAQEAAPRAAARGAPPELVAYTALVAAVSAGRQAGPFLKAVPEGLVGRERWRALEQLSGPPAQASAALSSALASEPADPMLAYYCRREGLRGRAASGSLAAAILAGDRATLESSSDPWARVAIARTLLEEGRVEQALVVANNGRQQAPLIAEAHALFAGALEAAGLDSAAGEALLLATRLAPWDPAHREALARLHWDRQEPWEAALGPYPLPERLAVVSAELRCRSGKPDTPPPGDHARHLAALGWCQLQASSLEEARNAFHGALGLDPQWTPAMLGLAEVHQRKGDVEGRIAHMRAAAATSPADPGISLALAEALTDRDRPAEALGVLTRLADGRRMDSQLEERIRQAALDAEEPGEWLDSWARTTHLAPSAVRGAAFLSLVALLCAPLILALGIGLRRPSSPWGFGEAVVALGVALVGPVVALPVLVRVVPEASMSLEGTPSPETLLWVLIATVLGEALAVGLILVLAWRTPEGWGRLGWRRMAPRWLVRVAAVELVVIAAGATWAMWLSGKGLEGVSQDVARVFVRTGDPIALGAAAILAILLAPLFEEILFRGMLQSVFTVHFGSWAGIFMTAVVFGGMHLAEPLSVPPLIVLGLGAGWLREASGSLWPAVFLHVLNNFLAAGLSLASGVAVWGLI